MYEYSEVDQFADMMKAKLRQHDATRGQGWKQTDVGRLLDRLYEEVSELEQALTNMASSEEIADEASDVANLAMMIADVCGGLEDLTP